MGRTCSQWKNIGMLSKCLQVNQQERYLQEGLRYRLEDNTSIRMDIKKHINTSNWVDSALYFHSLERLCNQDGRKQECFQNLKGKPRDF